MYSLFEQYLRYLIARNRMVPPTTEDDYSHALYLAWSNGYKRGFDEQRAKADNLIKRWAIEKEIENQVEGMVYDIKGQMLCRAQEFVDEMLVKLDE